jgi:hypothetical protein
MRFDHDDEQAFHARRDELAAEFGEWLRTHDVPGDASDAILLMDWKFGYGDGALDSWTVPEVGEFLLDWCPRKLSATPQHCELLPRSAAAFVDFLAHSHLLGPRSQPPGQIRRYCEKTTARFLRDMGDPTKFGMAKGLLARMGGLDTEAMQTPESIAELVERMNALPPDSPMRSLHQAGFDGPIVPDGAGRPAVGPIRLPDPQQRLAAVGDAADLRRLRLLAQWCPAPGRALTSRGNLRLDDARHLVAALDTGDDVEFDGYRSLTSATDLPGLSHLLDLALRAGAVRRLRGRLVAVARFAQLDDVAAHEQAVRALFERGLMPAGHSPVPDDLWAELGERLDVLFGALLVTGSDGLEIADLVEMTWEFANAMFVGLDDFILRIIGLRVRQFLRRLVDLAVVTITPVPEPCPDCDEVHESIRLTAAGVPVIVDMLRAAGVQVLIQPDPAAATATEIADLIAVSGPEEWLADATAWYAAQPAPASAAAAFVEALTAPDRTPLLVLAGLAVLEAVLGERSTDAVRNRLGGPHDGLLVQWLLMRSAIDPADVGPERITLGLIDMLATALDLGGPSETNAGMGLSAMTPPIATLEQLWRLDHPRLAEVLDMIGSDHPDKAVAKTARRSLMKLRSRMASAR